MSAASRMTSASKTASSSRRGGPVFGTASRSQSLPSGRANLALNVVESVSDRGNHTGAGARLIDMLQMVMRPSMESSRIAYLLLRT